TACNADSKKGVMQSPVPGSTLSSTTETFTWNNPGVEEFWLWVGTTPGGKEIYSDGQETNTSREISNLPGDGTTVYVRLHSMVNGEWLFNDYTYTAYSDVLVPLATINNTVITSLTLDRSLPQDHDDRFLYFASRNGKFSKVSIKDPTATGVASTTLGNCGIGNHVFSVDLLGEYLFFTVYRGYMQSGNGVFSLETNEVRSNLYWGGLDWNTTIMAAEEGNEIFIYWGEYGNNSNGFFKRNLKQQSVMHSGGLTLYGNEPTDGKRPTCRPIEIFCMDDTYAYIAHHTSSSRNIIRRVNRNNFSSDVIFEDTGDFPKVFNLTVDDTYVYFLVHGSNSETKGKVCRIDKSLIDQTPESSSFKVLVDATDSNQPVGVLEDGAWIYYLDNEVYKISKNGGTPVKKTNGLKQSYNNSFSGNPSFVQDDAYIYLTVYSDHKGKIYSIPK
ncbi:MAG: hypothetical protein GY754_24175, partial [bacterium]|nr:hypothetical protein [bacterium]